MEFQEEEILTACALRFDGYKYCEETSFDYNKALDDYFDSGRWETESLEQLATFFMLQRGLFKWNLEYEPQNGKYWEAFRSLFLEVCLQEIPVVFRRESYWEEWESKFAPRVKSYAELIRRIHETTAYKETNI